MIMPTYVLEMPKEPEAQKELGIENVQLFNEASYVISAINLNTKANHQRHSGEGYYRKPIFKKMINGGNNVCD